MIKVKFVLTKSNSFKSKSKICSHIMDNLINNGGNMSYILYFDNHMEYEIGNMIQDQIILKPNKIS